MFDKTYTITQSTTTPVQTATSFPISLPDGNREYEISATVAGLGSVSATVFVFAGNLQPSDCQALLPGGLVPELMDESLLFAMGLGNGETKRRMPDDIRWLTVYFPLAGNANLPTATVRIRELH